MIWLRKICAVILLLGLVIPLTTCMGSVEENGTEVSEPTYHYVLDEIDHWSAWLAIFAFTAPAVLVIFGEQLKPAIRVLAQIILGLLAEWSLLLQVVKDIFPANLALGGYIVLLSAAAYICVSIRELYHLLRKNL